MILTHDDKKRYMSQLTIFLPSISELDFALEQFKADKDRHCVVKRNNSGLYAVFTTGKYIGKPDGAELHRVEEEEGCVPVDVWKEGI